MSTIEAKKVRITKYFHENAFTRTLNLKSLYVNSKIRLVAPIDRTTRKFKTGLTELSAKAREEFEKELSLPVGTLDAGNKEFWAEFEIVIPTGGKTLDLSLPKDRLEYYVLASRKDVATSTGDLKSKLHGGNEHVFLMTSEDDEAIAKNTIRSYKSKAFALYNSMGVSEMRDLLLYTGKNAYGLSEDVLREKVGDILELNPKTFLDMLEGENYRDQVLIQKLIYHNILHTKGKAILQDGNHIAIDMDGAITFFNEPANQPIKISLLTALQEKEGGSKPKKNINK